MFLIIKQKVDKWTCHRSDGFDAFKAWNELEGTRKVVKTEEELLNIEPSSQEQVLGQSIF